MVYALSAWVLACAGRRLGSVETGLGFDQAQAGQPLDLGADEFDLALDRQRGAGSEALDPRPELDFPAPRAPLLHEDVQIGFGDGVGM
jgi:hypothetical protein